MENTYDIRRLALILAMQAEIEGMKFENLLREQYGQLHTYSHQDFQNKAEDLRNLAYMHDEQL